MFLYDDVILLCRWWDKGAWTIIVLDYQDGVNKKAKVLLSMAEEIIFPSKEKIKSFIIYIMVFSGNKIKLNRV